MMAALNLSMVFVLVLAPLYSDISLGCFLFVLVPRCLVALTYALIYVLHYLNFYQWLVRTGIIWVLHLCSLNTSPENSLNYCLSNCFTALVALVFLAIVRAASKYKKTCYLYKTFLGSSSIPTQLLVFLLRGARLYLIMNLFLEALTFASISNLVLLVAIFSYLCLKRRVAWVVCAALIFVFCLRYFSRFKGMFGFFANRNNLLFGFYYNLYSLLISVSFPDIRFSPRIIYFLNLSRALFIIWISHCLSFVDRRPPKPPANHFMLKTLKYLSQLFHSAKTFLIYFAVFFFAWTWGALNRLDLSETIYCGILLTVHLLFFKVGKRTKNIAFLVALGIYFLFILGRFFLNYYLLMFRVFEKSEDFTHSVEDFEASFSNNFEVMFPLSVKLLLCAISFRSLVQKLRSKSNPQKGDSLEEGTNKAKDENKVTNLRTQSTIPDFVVDNKKSPSPTHSPNKPNKEIPIKPKTSKPEETSPKSKSIGVEICKILAVFLREAVLLTTLFHFLSTPNLFKGLYLCAYLFYFARQISALADTIRDFRYRELLSLKTSYYRNCLLLKCEQDVPIPLINNQLLRQSLPPSQRLYALLFSRAITASLHSVIRKTWPLMFLALLIYLQTLFALKLFFAAARDRMFTRLLFNLDLDSSDALEAELCSVICVLAVTVFELYFIDMLRPKRVPNARLISRAVFTMNLAFYKFQTLKTSSEKLQVKRNRHACKLQNAFYSFRKLMLQAKSKELVRAVKMSDKLMEQFRLLNTRTATDLRGLETSHQITRANIRYTSDPIRKFPQRVFGEETGLELFGNEMQHSDKDEDTSYLEMNMFDNQAPGGRFMKQQKVSSDLRSSSPLKIDFTDASEDKPEQVESRKPSLFMSLKLGETCFCLSKSEKVLLISQNKQKLAFLEIAGSVFLIFKRLLLLPLLVGVLMASPASPFWLAAFALLFFSFKTKSLFGPLQVVNIVLIVLSVMEYAFLYFIDFKRVEILSLEYPLFKNIFETISQRPLSGLPFICLYTATAKGFFLLSGVLCFYSMPKLNQFTLSIRRRVSSTQTIFMVDFAMWKRSAFWGFQKLRKWALLSAVNVFFVLTIMVYMLGADGIAVRMALLLVFFWRLGFLWQKRRPLASQLNIDFTKYFSALSYLNWTILIFQLIPLHQWNFGWICDVQVHSPTIFALLIVSNLLISDCAASRQVNSAVETLLTERKHQNALYLANLSYDDNEIEIFRLVKEKLLLKHFEKKCKGFEQSMNPNESNMTSSRKRVRTTLSLGKKRTVTPRSRTIQRVLSEKESLRDLSVFPSTEDYKTFLKSKLSLSRNYWLKLKSFMVKKICNRNPEAVSFLHLISRFLHKNKEYIGSRQIDLLKLIRDDFGDLEDFVQKVNIERKLYKEQHFRLTIKNRLEELKHSVMVQEMPPVPNQSTPRLVYSKAGRGSKLARRLFAKLSIDRDAEMLFAAPGNRFSSDWFKLAADPSKKEFLILQNVLSSPSEAWRQNIGKSSSLLNFGIIYLKFALSVIRNNLEACLGLAFLLLFSLKQGFVAMTFTLAIVLLLVIEKRPKNTRFWCLLYLLFCTSFFIQLVIRSLFKLTPIDEKAPLDSFFPHIPQLELSRRWAGAITFFFGPLSLSFDLAALVFFEIVFLHVGPNFKNKRPDLARNENRAQALYRLTQNKGWPDFYKQMQRRAALDLTALESHVKNKVSGDTPSIHSLRLALIKTKTRVYKSDRPKFVEFLSLLEDVSLEFNRDRRKFAKSKFSSYLWRNFSFRLRKTGIDLQNASITVLVILLVYFFIFYHQLENDLNKDVMTIINNNKVQGTLGVNFSILFLFICLERFMYCKTNTGWLAGDPLCTDQTKQLLCDVHLSSRRQIAFPLHRLRKFCWKVVNARRFVKKITSDTPQQEYRKNPLIQKFIFSLLVFGYLSFLIFIWLPQNSVRGRALSVPFLDAVFCNDSFNTVGGSLELGTMDCNNFSSNGYLQVFYLLSCLYLLITGIQVHRGYSRLSGVRHQELEDFWQIGKFFFYKYTPFIREIKTIIDYTSSPTALNLFQWFKTEDIETTVKSARVSEKFNRHSGREMRSWVKRLLGFSFLTFFFLLLVMPLFLFSDIIPSNKIDELLTARLRAEIRVENLQLNIFDSKQFSLSPVSSLSSDYPLIRKHEKLKLYELDLYRELELKRFSEDYFVATAETLRHLEDNFGENTPIQVDISLSFETDFKPKLQQHAQFELSGESGHTLIKMLTSNDCRVFSGEKIILGESGRVIMLKKLVNEASVSALKQESIAEMGFYYVLKYNCDLKSGKPFFEISDENQENLRFLVLQENLAESVELLARLSKNSKISLKSVYIIIFSYIGLTVIRSAFFGMAHRIWTIEIPDAHRLEERLYLIAFCRAKGDYFSEARFYYELIDLFRAPDEIKRITGNFADRSLNSAYA